MKLEAGYVEVSGLVAEQIAKQCNELGGQVFRIEQQDFSKDGFFEAVRQNLPLDPPVRHNRIWDALADSLWSGIDGVQAECVVILWQNAFQWKRLEPEDFAIASTILQDLCESLGDPATTAGSPKKLAVLTVN